MNEFLRHYDYGDGNTGRLLSSRAVSLTVHAGGIALLWFFVTSPPFAAPTHNDQIFYLPAPLRLTPSHAQGGGGQRQNLPILETPAPKYVPRAYVPPNAQNHPLLPVEAMLMTEDAPSIAGVSAMGNPLGSLLGGGGPGSRGALGNGDGGVGAGPGPGGGGSNGPQSFTIGNGVTAPSVISQVDPEYSEEARKAKFSGSVLLSIVVNPDGSPDELHVTRSAGMGLDQKALDAVTKWKFRPGTKDGKKVRVRALIEVFFRLL